MAQNSGISSTQAIQNSRAATSKWPGRTSGNRLEPECWPALNPTFSFDKTTKLFTIGSCFAQYIKSYLLRNDFSVLGEFNSIKMSLDGSVEPRGPGLEIGELNKYTPFSILQEIEWTKMIREKGGVIQAEDISQFLIDMGNGLYFDSQRLNEQTGTKTGFTLDQILQNRRAYYDIFNHVFNSETIILTLGLIEAWYDTQTEKYVEFGPYILRFKSSDRFMMKRLHFNEVLECLDRIIELLNEDIPRNILITTSPVPLTRTFSDDDIIVANMRSKSVLRAATAEIVEKHDRVDYFPSFESVMLTKQDYVWEDDLIHPNRQFIDRIMKRVVFGYVPNEETIEQEEQFKTDDASLRVGSLVNLGRYREAFEILSEIDATKISAANARLSAGIVLAVEGEIHRANTVFESFFLEGAPRNISEFGDPFLAFVLCHKIGDKPVEKDISKELTKQKFRANPQGIFRILREAHANADTEIFEILVDVALECDDVHVNDKTARFFHHLTLGHLRNEDFAQALETATLAQKLAPSVRLLNATLDAVKQKMIPNWLAASLATLD